MAGALGHWVTDVNRPSTIYIFYHLKILKKSKHLKGHVAPQDILTLVVAEAMRVHYTSL